MQPHGIRLESVPQRSIDQSINPGFLKWPKLYKLLLGPLEGD